MKKLSESPLWQLKDKLDFRQSLYEIWAAGDEDLLEEFTGVTTKPEQERALNYYLNEKNFAYGKQFPGLLKMLRHYFEQNDQDRAQLETVCPAIFEHYLTLKKSAIAKNGIKTTLKKMLDYKVLVSGNWKDGTYEDRTWQLAGYILAYHPDFPEDLLEITVTTWLANQEQTKNTEWNCSASTASAFYSLIDPEDWIMGFIEMCDEQSSGYGLKTSSQELRITYWNYNKDDKKRTVSREIDSLKPPLTSLFNAHTLERMRENFLEAAEDAAHQVQNKIQPSSTVSVRQLVEAVCKREGLTPEYVGDFCKAVLLQLPSLKNEFTHDPAATRFFDYLSHLSRSINYSVKDRKFLHTLDYDGLMQGVFEATHSMCLTQGRFLMSENYLFRDVVHSFDFPKAQAESDKTLKDIRSFYRQNWQVIENILKEELEPKDYKRLQSWIRDCRQHIEQAWKHREKVNLWNICGPYQFVFADAANPSYQHASIALFADILKNELVFQPPIPRSINREREGRMSNHVSKPQSEASTPDLIADRMLPLLGNDGWVWLQALYETWAWPRLGSDYPFKQGLNAAEKASLMRRIKKYWIKNASLFLLEAHPNGSKEEKERLLEQCKMVALQLENAHQHQDSSTINEIVEPFAKADGWFCQDLYMHILNNPLSFFDFKQIAPDADDSEKPFDRQFTLGQFLRAVEKVGQYMHYNSKGTQEEYDRFFSWLENHAETFVTASSLLQWEMHDKYMPMDDKPFSQWLDTTIAQLESAINQTQSVTCIRDYLAAWMDPDFPHPQLDDFVKLTITRESLSCLDDFALEHFDKPINEMAYWDILRHPCLYLLAHLYKRGFFTKLVGKAQSLPESSVIIQEISAAPETMQLPEDSVLFSGRLVKLSPMQYLFLKGAYHLKAGEKIDELMKITLNKGQKDKTKNEIAGKMRIAKDSLFIRGTQFLQPDIKKSLKW